MSGKSSYSEIAKELFDKLERAARASGYNLNPDTRMTLELCEGLATNLRRFGYLACPCRLAEGEREKDLDIICPCDYRDEDLFEYGSCYCALYVSDDIAAGKKEAGSIPERRLSAGEREAEKAQAACAKTLSGLWRCKVCGYLCAMPHAPGVCPVCKAERDRFEAFTMPAASPVWRCKVCGYLCAAEHAPSRCPICQADRDRFEKFG
jgi:ferredoxin-thioredoxin reductase catalytic subunit/rubredoxin